MSKNLKQVTVDLNTRFQPIEEIKKAQEKSAKRAKVAAKQP